MSFLVVKNARYAYFWTFLDLFGAGKDMFWKHDVHNFLFKVFVKNLKK